MPLTELQRRALAHKLHRCRDCKDEFPELDTWGRCEDCAEDIAREVAAAEAAAGWDPYP